ncbi:acetate/propionate family kinase [Aureimonas fodinaquatilis]|uniref:Acetate kinase n=1 Tax=Aureimonas fodinaquatilis TaxID=2565783 RepID=A0A5B0DP41_9HYPH|nr:acetate/propionate family kinase [Aureimonas fodinaquatilis]KAA0968524.1 acetate/propionate family kinase [Aureimonas fodinaquatilis]
MSHLLVLNAGSSSLKFAVFDRALAEICRGAISAMGSAPRFQLETADDQSEKHAFSGASLSMDDALAYVLKRLADRFPNLRIAAIGHRIVHGGVEFTKPAVLTSQTLAKLRELEPLAPLHQPYNLAIVAEAQKHFPDAVQIGCFDTAFHANRPKLQKLYGLPRALIDEGMISYGFHGLSFQFISGQLRKRFGCEAGGKVIVLHLGSGSSLCAMQNGHSLATTMGFSPLDGPVMATRCGTIDPGILLHLMLRKGMQPQAVEDLLYRKSGLAGLSGTSGDMQSLLADTSDDAQETLDYFVLSVSRQIGALAASMGGVDHLVFTAGIGENSAPVRARLANAAGWLGLELNEAANDSGAVDIADKNSRIGCLVLKTNEELAMAEGMATLLEQ